MSGYVFRLPPTWPPAPSPAWTPPQGWGPDPTWAPPPPDWQFWVAAGPGEVGIAAPTYQPRQRWVYSARAARRCLAAFLFGGLIVVAVAVLSAAAWILDRPLINTNEFAVIYPLAFVELGFSGVILEGLGKRRGASRRTAAASLPAAQVVGAIPSRLLDALYVAGGIAVLNAIVCFVMLFGIDGQPSYDAGLRRYEADDHGSITVVSKAVFEHDAALQDRAFLAFTAIFVVLSLPVTLGRWLAYRRPATPLPPPRPEDPPYNWEIRLSGSAVYPLRGRNAVRAARTVELRADLRGMSLREYLPWADSRMYDALLSPKLRRRGDWYTDWADVASVECTERSITLHLAGGSEVRFTLRGRESVRALVRLMRYRRVPGVLPVQPTGG